MTWVFIIVGTSAVYLTYAILTLRRKTVERGSYRADWDW